jgi:hypothetical protein
MQMDLRQMIEWLRSEQRRLEKEADNLWSHHWDKDASAADRAAERFEAVADYLQSL